MAHVRGSQSPGGVRTIISGPSSAALASLQKMQGSTWSHACKSVHGAKLAYCHGERASGMLNHGVHIQTTTPGRTSTHAHSTADLHVANGHAVQNWGGTGKLKKQSLASITVSLQPLVPCQQPCHLCHLDSSPVLETWAATMA